VTAFCTSTCASHRAHDFALLCVFGVSFVSASCWQEYSCVRYTHTHTHTYPPRRQQRNCAVRSTLLLSLILEHLQFSTHVAKTVICFLSGVICLDRRLFGFWPCLVLSRKHRGTKFLLLVSYRVRLTCFLYFPRRKRNVLSAIIVS
jgi:hypothetical protein